MLQHHCRLCGRIFCWQCSDNWIDTVASRGKSRVCNECYIDHTQDLPDSLNSSVITGAIDVDTLSVAINSGDQPATPHGLYRWLLACLRF